MRDVSFSFPFLHFPLNTIPIIHKSVFQHSLLVFKIRLDFVFTSFHFANWFLKGNLNERNSFPMLTYLVVE